MTLAPEQVHRYARHLLVPEVGRAGQERLLAATVSVALTPGDGAAVAALAYLAAAGVGHLRLAGDTAGPVTAADLAAALLYRTADLGRPRGDVLIDHLHALNPDVHVAVGAGEPLAIARTGDRADSLILGAGAAVTAIAALTS
ncbi:MAG TPA: ThiF family adenylyltransferase [Kofleriaceae bacterium]|jgi:adenylyltransferase/sulfurtransferase|nr:ThiF family adenylyltransferase [Kofleriaceae bacterium]